MQGRTVSTCLWLSSLRARASCSPRTLPPSVPVFLPQPRYSSAPCPPSTLLAPRCPWSAQSCGSALDLNARRSSPGSCGCVACRQSRCDGRQSHRTRRGDLPSRGAGPEGRVEEPVREELAIWYREVPGRRSPLTGLAVSQPAIREREFALASGRRARLVRQTGARGGCPESGRGRGRRVGGGGRAQCGER